MFSTEIKAGDRIHIGSAVITLESKTGKRARLRIDTGGYTVRVETETSRQVEEPCANRPVEICTKPV